MFIKRQTSIINICRSFLSLAADDAYPIGDPMNAKIYFYVLSTVVQSQLCPQHSSSVANAFPRVVCLAKETVLSNGLSSTVIVISQAFRRSRWRSLFCLHFCTFTRSKCETNWVRKLSHVLGSQHIRKLAFTASDHKFPSVDESEGDFGDSFGSDG